MPKRMKNCGFPIRNSGDLLKKYRLVLDNALGDFRPTSPTESALHGWMMHGTVPKCGGCSGDRTLVVSGVIEPPAALRRPRCGTLSAQFRPDWGCPRN